MCGFWDSRVFPLRFIREAIEEVVCLRSVVPLGLPPIVLSRGSGWVGPFIHGLEDGCNCNQACSLKNTKHVNKLDLNLQSLSVSFNTLKKDFEPIINHHLVPQQNPLASSSPCVCYPHLERCSTDFPREFLWFGLTGGSGRVFLIPVSESPSECGLPRSTHHVNHPRHVCPMLQECDCCEDSE